MKRIKYEGWTTFDGRFVTFEEIDHQHLSNVLWFNEIFHNRTRYNCEFTFQLGMVLHRRFDGIRLPWAPLPVPNEVEALKQMGLLMKNGDIIGNRNTTINEGKVIGSINHIKQDNHEKY